MTVNVVKHVYDAYSPKKAKMRMREVCSIATVCSQRLMVRRRLVNRQSARYAALCAAIGIDGRDSIPERSWDFAVEWGPQREGD